MAWHPFRNLALKASALALGTLLWFTVSGEQVERSLQVPIAYRNLPAGLEIMNQLETVEVQVRGGSGEVTSLQPSEVSVIADLSGREAGDAVMLLGPDRVSVPLGIEVVQVNPSTVPVRLERQLVAEVEVTAMINGRPALNYVLDRIIVEPRTVAVIGPASRLSGPISAVTEGVSVEGLTATVSRIVGVGVTDARLRLREAREVKVTVVIAPASAVRTISGRPVAFRNLADGQQATVEPSTVAVTVQGRTTALAALLDVAVEPYVDLQGATIGRQDLPVRVDLPLGYTVLSIRPVNVSVRIR